jgi:methylphosphotriester-DNA--protein-cysteine methyltransferase
MIHHSAISDNDVRKWIRAHRISLAGNCKLKIFGLLSCHSGKRMRRSSRVFFESAAEAMENSYRPCGHCMRQQYAEWKKRQEQ